jgi:hypothetical protein
MTPAPDLAEFEALSVPKKRTCPLGLALGALDETEAEQLRAALALDKGRITGAAIIQWLKRRNLGDGVSPGFVASHRAGTCSCV